MFRKYMAALLLLPVLSAAACVSASAEEHPDAGGAAVPCPPGYGPQIPGGMGQARDCLADLPADKQKRAVQIMEEAMPALRDLDGQIGAKRRELEQLNFNDGSDPEQLARLGRELQELRDSMKEKLSQVSDRLRTETGLDLRVPDTRGCRSMHRVYMRGRIHGHE